ncbi:hypothetical protein XFF6166_160041 [Xanthomonas citri pv. fuscans]|nr:hypothetical protein XFF6166_160041 [Xanthomonas citri pv. fuscans]SON99032.1 hypothetical protein XFF6960_110061 [Xanthomonas citri pv. fuscans]SOO04843.1 hypothetical protein XFF7767_310061 [Xanthomonas citri pv. fuscans]SOO14222.1 hypothetical protein XFF7766_290001 [Xanthomonas citri pv. fuscans]SOO43338.1 hypothetical protein XFF1815_340002 [Xanthomonas citri pv. fuscans]
MAYRVATRATASDSFIKVNLTVFPTLRIMTPKPSQAKNYTYAQTPDNATSIDAKTLGCYSASHC